MPRTRPSIDDIANVAADILLAPGGTSTRLLAKQFGVSKTTIASLRSGKRYTDLFPDLPRRQELRRCNQCVHWGRQFRLPFPEGEFGGRQPRASEPSDILAETTPPFHCTLGIPEATSRRGPQLKTAASCSAYHSTTSHET